MKAVISPSCDELRQYQKAIGEILHQMREGRWMTPNDVTAMANVRRKYLNALEN